MSIGKFLGGTVIATPAVGGGGYVIYKEVTKEEEAKPDSHTESTRDEEVAPGSKPAAGAESPQDKVSTGEASDTPTNVAVGTAKPGTDVPSGPAQEALARQDGQSLEAGRGSDT